MGSLQNRLLGSGIRNANVAAADCPAAAKTRSRQLSSTELRIDAARDGVGRTGSEPDLADIPVAELKALAQKNRPATGKWSTGKRAFVLLAVLIAPVLLGAGALLASDGPRTSLLGWLSSMSSERMSSEKSQTETEPSGQALHSMVQPADAAMVQPAQGATSSSAVSVLQEPGAGASYSQLERRIEALAHSLSALQEKIEQLGVTQEQTVREIGKLRELEQDFRKLQSAPAANAVPVPPRKKASAPAPQPTAASTPPATALPPATNLLPENPEPEPKPVATPSFTERLLGLIPRPPLFQRSQ